LGLNVKIRSSEKLSKIGEMGMKASALGQVLFVNPVPCEILDEHRRDPGVLGHQDSHGRNVTEDEPAAALQNKLCEVGDLFLLEG
jgi:hypothetical protein